MDEAEHVAMVLPGGECSAKRGRSQQLANKEQRGRRGCCLWRVFLYGGGVLQSHKHIHT